MKNDEKPLKNQACVGVARQVDHLKICDEVKLPLLQLLQVSSVILHGLGHACEPLSGFLDQQGDLTKQRDSNEDVKRHNSFIIHYNYCIHIHNSFI